jgi:DNA invertase Pin-like site-specific DNA recombinase
MPRCALYARTSTADKGQTPQNQLRQLRAFARSQGWKLAAEFVDLASGARADRPQFQAMLESASRREFDLLLFWSLDHFSREGILETLTSLKRLSDCGVKYRSLQESYIDTTNPSGDLLAAFVAKIAALERERIRERIFAGLERARAEGRHLGRPRAAVREARVGALRRKGMSIREIARETGVSPMTVQRILKGREQAA